MAINKKVILIGGGGHALSLLEMIDNFSMIQGYADIKPNSLLPVDYLGDDEYILKHYSPDFYKIHHALVYKDKVNLSLRKKMIELYRDYETYSFIASSALVSSNSKILAGTAIFERSVINRSSIGNNTIINTGSIIEHGCKIGNNVFIAPGVIIGGGAIIKDNVFVGSGTIIRDDITICSDTVIGMGSLVTRNISVPGKYYGRPIKLIERYE